MTPVHRGLRTFTMAAAVVLYSAVSSPQTAGNLQVHDRQDRAEAALSQGGAAGKAGMPRDVMARMAALDERIDMLVTDMHMFVGDLKVETMAALLTAVAERQFVMRDEMRRMHDSMMRRMVDHGPAASAADEPGTMCSPLP